MTTNLHYTTHHNWEWVLDEAIHIICTKNKLSHTKLTKFKELPSQTNVQSKATYSLFRIDLTFFTQNDAVVIGQVRATSESFGFLDPKDALYKQMVSCNVADCMPRTTLIEWDNDSDIAISDFPSCPALLKASLGSGGFGLYFVYTSRDILEVMQAHRRRAERANGFLDGLRRDYGHVPHWSLQQLIPSVRVAAMDNRRCQIRGYVVECGGRLYLYETYEVRVPGWRIDLDAVLAEEHARSQTETPRLNNGESRVFEESVIVPPAAPRWSDEVENECCGAGNARPYNEQRDKSITQRFLISEIAELSSSEVRDAIHNTLRTSLAGIQESILSRCRPVAVSSQISSLGAVCHIAPSTMAVAGIDLLVSRDEEGRYSAHIVEINNNPAMPAPGKHMSPLYREHLVTMAAEILLLGLRVAADGSGDSTEGGDELSVKMKSLFSGALLDSQNGVEDGGKFELI